MREERQGYAYIMASGGNRTLYIGVTSDLPGRAYLHGNALVEGFTKKHGCKSLVWYEAHDTIEGARYRELQMKKMESVLEADGDREDESGLGRSVRVFVLGLGSRLRGSTTRFGA
jgi:putative endonuclease